MTSDGGAVYRSLLLGYDERPAAADALALASLLAVATGARLDAVHVTEHEQRWVTYDREFQHDLREHENRLRGGLRPAFAELGGDERCSFRTVPALSPAHGLRAVAREEGTDALVLGSTHQGPLGRVLLGTTASGILAGAPFDVLVAPRGFAERGEAGLRAVGVGLDGSPASEAALGKAVRLAGSLGAGLVAATVASGRRRTRAVEGREEAAERLAATLERSGASVERAVVLDGEPAHALAELARGLDLLVVGSPGAGAPGHAALGSVTGALMRRAPAPVLVAPPAPG